MGNRSGARAAWAALASLTTIAGAQAQDVHKCTVSGQVIYQAQPCPSGDVVLPPVAVPSDQEARQAQSELWRQRMQASTGRLVRPAYVPPPPPPPPRPTVILPATTTTTTVVVPAAGGTTVTVRQVTRTPAQVVYAPPAKPLNNCEKLNRDNSDLLDRREQLQAPGRLASREELLHKAEADLAHVQEMAKASSCRLLR